jgi:hypothetical protein
VTTKNANDLIVACSRLSLGGTLTSGPTNGFTELVSIPSSVMLDAYVTTTATSTYQTSWLVGTSQTSGYQATTASFKAAVSTASLDPLFFSSD